MNDLVSIFAGHDLPTIDLHGTRFLQDALEQLEKELFFFFQKGEKNVRVIHGIGTGKLAHAVHEALTKNPMVVEFGEEETGGSCIICF